MSKSKDLLLKQAQEALKSLRPLERRLGIVSQNGDVKYIGEDEIIKQPANVLKLRPRGKKT